MDKISVVVSTYNEEKNIKACLDSVKDLADEIIIVDNSSTDDTVNIAKKYTKKIFHQKNDPRKIDAQKNLGFSKASNEWVLYLDADERLTPELRKEIKAVLADEDAKYINGYEIPRKNIIFGKWIKSDMWWPDYQLRLFRVAMGGYPADSVHKGIRVEGVTGRLDNYFLHENYLTVSQYILKLNTYTDIEAESIIRDGYSFNFLDSLRFPIDDFVKTFFLQKGYRDGLHGLMLSILQAFYMEVVFAKLWEKRSFEDVNDTNFLKSVKKEFVISGEKIKYWFTTTAINSSENPVKKLILKTSRKLTSNKINKK